VAAARAAEWATAIVAARASLAVNLSTLTAVPPALEAVAPDLPSLKEVLQHFFTYTAEGDYYPRWAGAGRDAANPTHLTPAYKQHNVLEQQLERDQVYLYAVLPEPLLAGGGDLGGGVFREVVIRFQPTGVPTAPFSLAAVHTVRMRPASAPFCDFVFFYAAAGVGIPLPRTTLDTMTTRLISLVGQLSGTSSAESVLAGSEVVSPADSGAPLVHLIATVTGQPTLPPGVISSSDDSVRVLLTPPDQVAAVAALPQVTHLGLLAPNELHNDLARGAVSYPALDAKLPAGKKGGQGVLVGIIDSGIDGSHPAFAGRIHAVWDQGNPTAVAGNTPAANHPGNAAYAAFNFGAELTGAAVNTSVDINYVNSPPPAVQINPANGHGTHVAGTAAGAEVRDGAGNVLVPAGMAPLARIAVVRAIQSGRGNAVLAAQWIFQKATELGVPCVINMSFGQHFHAHDGSDDQARNLFGLCRDGAGNYRPGRILVASAGNSRRDNIHLRRSVPAHNVSPFTIATLQLEGVNQQVVSIWIKDPTGTKPAAFPLSVYIYRRTQRRNTFKDVTRAIRLGTQAVATTAPPNPAGVFANHRTQVEVTSKVSDPINGDHNFQLKFSTTSATLPMIGNQWGIALVNESDQPLDVHLWVPDGPARFTDADRDDDHAYLVGTPAASAAAISVASSNSRLSWTSLAGPRTATGEARVNELSSFSSPGPLRASSIPPATFYGVAHEVNGVDVAAPGAFVHSAMSSQVATPAWLAVPGNASWALNNLSRVMSGTSMAAPVITGLIANVLADEPTLTLPQVLARLKSASTIPPDSDYPAPAGGGAKPLSVDWGYGLVNAGQLKP
ncbi:MAG: S8 family serine peptidase, partial [Propionibacteriaceae bacterium]